MSYLEIYNENIRDLLDPSTGYLELRDESRGKNIQVTGSRNSFGRYVPLFNGCSYFLCFPQSKKLIYIWEATLLVQSFCSSDPDNSQDLVE